MAAKMAAFHCLILVAGISVAYACVSLECSPSDNSSSTYYFGGLNNWLVIFAIVAACLVGLVLLILMIWLACWCCYRQDVSSAPNVVRRVVLRRKEIVRQKKVNLQVVPPPPPVVQHLPTEKIVVVQPVPAKPQSLMLTVSENPNYAPGGPVMTTRLEQPLTFTLTPEFSNQQRDLRIYEAQAPRNDFTPVTLGHSIHGCDDCRYHQ